MPPLRAYRQRIRGGFPTGVYSTGVPAPEVLRQGEVESFRGEGVRSGCLDGDELKEAFACFPVLPVVWDAGALCQPAPAVLSTSPGDACLKTGFTPPQCATSKRPGKPRTPDGPVHGRLLLSVDTSSMRPWPLYSRPPGQVLPAVNISPSPAGYALQ